VVDHTGTISGNGTPCERSIVVTAGGAHRCTEAQECENNSKRVIDPLGQIRDTENQSLNEPMREVYLCEFSVATD
jgi:hypothetical protein